MDVHPLIPPTCRRRRACTRTTYALLAASACLPAAEPATTAKPMQEVVVIGITPVEGLGLPREKIAGHVRTVTMEDLERSQSQDLTDFMNRNLGSVSINSAQNNPLQPDVQFRGFTASPLLGLPQGLAVYQDGARINEPLGDAVNWDLLPVSAIHSINLIGGANPLFGLNTLGGALTIDMKNGFTFEGHQAEVSGGSWGRFIGTAESGGNNGTFGYYVNVRYFEEDGWRDLSESDATTVYGALSWHGERSSLDLGISWGDSFLTGNGALPIGQLAIDRESIFTAPDITENDMHMLTFEGTHDFSDELQVSGSGFWRENETSSFNGDGSEFIGCRFAGGGQALLEFDGEEDDVEDELGVEIDDICEGGDPAITSAADLEAAIAAAAVAAGLDPEDFEFEDVDELSGTGVLTGEAINNISSRTQDSRGADVQVTTLRDLFGRDNHFVLGVSWYEGDSEFVSRTELARLDPVTRSTEGLGVGTFVDEAATHIETSNTSYSVYFSNTLSLTERLAFTFAGRWNTTDIELRDRSGERPELDGDHTFDRFNPAVGLTFQARDDINLYGNYSESARAPTPIELSCNEDTFQRAQQFAIARGDDPDDVEFECRLPNAFLADPPLEQVVAKGFEFGARGRLARETEYHLGFYRTVNEDDIVFQTTGRSTGLFANVDETRRMGVETELAGRIDRLRWFMNYGWVDATFESDFLALSPAHPFANADGEIAVREGDRIPGIPQHTLKVGGDYAVTPAIAFGGEVVYNSDQHFRGDESNQLDTVDGYALLNLRASYRFGEHVVLFGRVDNVLDSDYENFGLIGEDPSEILTGLTDTRPLFLGAGAPRAGWIGVRVRL